MPCRDEWNNAGVVYRDDPVLRKRLDLVTRVACEAIGMMPNSLRCKLSKEAKDWWAAHSEADRRREAREKAQRDVQRTRERILSKLTAEEKRVLGIK